MKTKVVEHIAEQALHAIYGAERELDKLGAPNTSMLKEELKKAEVMIKLLVK
jgi:hypothetical protein